jgi:amidase
MPMALWLDAGHIDALLARGVDLGVLAGIPIVHKDLTAAKGLRFTSGSPIYADRIADHDSVVVHNLKAAGGVTIGKSNVPEFGAGSQTFNPIFGATRNPHDLTRTSGGSSGGGRRFACGMVPLADGSDMGGSLRNPAAFCGVVGFRPSPGVVANPDSWSPLAVDCPMARNVADVALMLSALAVYDPALHNQCPSILVVCVILMRCCSQVNGWRGRSIGAICRWSRPLVAVLAQQRQRLVELGCIVEDVSPDFTGARESFQILRALGFETGNCPCSIPTVICSKTP